MSSASTDVAEKRERMLGAAERLFDSIVSQHPCARTNGLKEAFEAYKATEALLYQAKPAIYTLDVIRAQLPGNRWCDVLEATVELGDDLAAGLLDDDFGDE